MIQNENDRPPMTWGELGMEIAFGGPPYHEWREAPWHSFTISDNDQKLPRVHAFELTEKPYGKLLDEAVELWLKDKPLPPLDKTATFLLGVRFQVVGALLMSFDSVGSL